MRRSSRAKVPAAHKWETTRSVSPSASEVTLGATPSCSPSPEDIARHAAPPTLREDGTPKRPMNAFILFSNEKRAELADRNPHLSNAAVSVLLGQRWRDMPSGEKSSYVIAARKIKEEFVLAHPDAKSRGIRKPKRKMEGGLRIARNLAPPSLHALALVGSRLNQESWQSALGDAPSPEEEQSEHNFSEHSYNSQPSQPTVPARVSPSLLDQLCTVAENEHTAAAHMLSALASF